MNDHGLTFGRGVSKLIVATGLASFLTVSGCAVLGLSQATEEQFRGVKVGQTEKMVEEKLGLPESRSKKGRGQIWHYRVLSQDRRYSDPYDLYFEDGVLQKIQYDSNSAREDAAIDRNRTGTESEVPQSCSPISPVDGKSSGPTCDPSHPPIR